MEFRRNYISCCRGKYLILNLKGNGSVVVGTLVERSVTWQNMEIKLDENNKLTVNDFEKNTISEIDFRDNLVDMKAGYNYLIVVTSSQCHIYPIHVSTIIFIFLEFRNSFQI